MRRRGFLGAASAGLAVTLWPAWLREAFGEDAVGPVNDLRRGALRPFSILVGAFQRARDDGEPLLVLVVPADDREKGNRGQAFGELLNHGGDRDLAPLAGAVVVCASMADLRRLVPGAGDGEPLMVLVEPARHPIAARRLDAPLPAHRRAWADPGQTQEQQQQADDAISDQRIAVLGRLLREGLGLDERRSAALAASARARLTAESPSGSRWARSTPCGVDFEGEKRERLVMCGLAHTPRKSYRFLYFFSRR